MIVSCTCLEESSFLRVPPPLAGATCLPMAAPPAGFWSQKGVADVTALKCRSLISRCQQTHNLSKDSRNISFLASSWLLMGACNPWPSLAYNCFTPIHTFVFTKVIFSLCGSMSPNSPLIVRIWISGFMPHLIQYDLLLTWLHLLTPYFQIRSHSQVLGGHEVWGEHYTT